MKWKHKEINEELRGKIISYKIGLYFTEDHDYIYELLLMISTFFILIWKKDKKDTYKNTQNYMKGQIYWESKIDIKTRNETILITKLEYIDPRKNNSVKYYAGSYMMFNLDKR